jgi:hypothetical protein
MTVGFQEDFLEKIVNVNFAPMVYIVFFSNASHSPVPLKDGVKILDVRISLVPEDPTITIPICGTLLECSSNIGLNFLSYTASFGSIPGADEAYNYFVLPHKAELIANWFQDYCLDLAISRLHKAYLWWQQQESITSESKFSMMYTPHLLRPRPGDQNAMVQMWIMSGASQTIGEFPPDNSSFFTFGQEPGFYRTDKKASGPIYMWPPEWRISPWNSNGDLGLPYGKPPLISADVLNTDF